MEYPNTWTCETTASSTICNATATTTGDSVTYHDWLFVNGIQIFLLAFIGISMIFSLVRTTK